MGLAEISFFEFGNTYRYVVGDGRERRFDALDDLLLLMGELFRLEFHTYVPQVNVYKRSIGFRPSVGDPLGQRATVRTVLRVTPGKLGLPASDDWIEGIRKRVTHYNLSGSWDYFETENL